MPLVGGSVTVNPTNGTHSGTGWALALFNARLASMPASQVDPTTPQYGMSAADWIATVVKLKQPIADQVNVEAPALINYLVANTVVNTTVSTTTTITTGPSSNGIQRLPAAFVAGADCEAPTSPHDLSGTGTGTGTIS